MRYKRSKVLEDLEITLLMLTMKTSNCAIFILLKKLQKVFFHGNDIFFQNIFTSRYGGKQGPVYDSLGCMALHYNEEHTEGFPWHNVLTAAFELTCYSIDSPLITLSR